MHPRHRPKGLITLVNRSSTTLYSGMVPGLIANLYSRDQVAIDLASAAGVPLPDQPRVLTHDEKNNIACKWLVATERRVRRIAGVLRALAWHCLRLDRGIL